MKSYLILLFVACFLFSMQGEAKLLTTKEVAAKKLEKKAALKAKNGKSKKAVVAKSKKAKNKRQVASRLKKDKKSARKVVRLDFEKKAVNNKVKPRKELKKIAKAEKAQKKSFKSIDCADGFIVGQRAFCSTTTNELRAEVKGLRSLASDEINMESKKLK